MRLLRGQRLYVRAAARWSNAVLGLTLWRPGTKSLHGQKGRVARTVRLGKTQRLSYPAPEGGWYVVALRIARHGGGRYALQLSKSS